MTCPLANSQRYLFLAPEDTWGTAPGSPDYFHLPVFSYTVKNRIRSRQANPFIGNLQNKHNRMLMSNPVGTLHTALYGWFPSGIDTSLAETMLNWGFGDYNTVCGASYLAEWGGAGDADTRQHLGLRVDTAVLKASENEPYVDLTLGLEGYNEATYTTSQTLPNDMNKLVEFEWPDVKFYIGASSGSLSLLPVRAFALQRQRGLQSHFMNSAHPSYLAATKDQTSLVVVPLKTGKTYDGYLRSLGSTELYGRLVLKGLHNDSNTGITGSTDYTQVQIDLPRISLMNKDDSDDQPEGHTFETLNWICLKPDSSSNAVSITVTYT